MVNRWAYMPLHALQERHILSILSIALAPVNDQRTKFHYDHHHSRRTMLFYLLSIKNGQNNESVLKIIKNHQPQLDWTEVQREYDALKMIPEPYKKQYHVQDPSDYWELNRKTDRPGPKQAFSYISRFRSHGFQLNELKIYWNYQEIESLNQKDRFNPITDSDTNLALQEFPVEERKNRGNIEYRRSGIEKAVFEIPADKQIIVLDFADERMPGGYFLENAQTQEEVILFNSDGYHALLDLKYKFMQGGYMLPEYGVAYIKNVRFYQKEQETRVTDLIVAACYDVSGIGEGLYSPPPKSDLEENTREKFKAIIAAAVANTNGSGANTYLLLGPIGTGAFGNDMQMIARIFSQILNEPLMGSTGPIRQAFDQIWFVSIDSLSSFQKEFDRHVKSSL